VSTTQRDAEALLVPQQTTPGQETPVTMVVMHGHFVDSNAAVRKGAHAPTGPTLTQLLGPAGEVLAEACCVRSPALAALGSATRFLPAGAMAGVASGHHFRRRARARAATWGRNGFCSKSAGYNGEGNHHCYAIATWLMSGGERVLGTQAEIDSTAMSVPEWETGSFVTHEEWVDFGTPREERWVEVGNMGGGGSPGSCCGVQWFYAASWGPNDFYSHQHIWNIPMNTYAFYAMEWVGGSRWCYMIGPDWEVTYACVEGFQGYSTELQVGMEVADERMPSSSGSDYVNAEWTDHSFHNWNFAEGSVSVPQLCYSHNGPYPGNINFGTC
jgi:hypothetical protein